MENRIEILSLNCSSCGAQLENFKEKLEVKCDFCDNVTKIIRPVKVISKLTDISESETARFTNFVAILEKSMVAGNYKEAYDYCNKALEIDPQSAALWENKAISCFWIRTDSDIIETEAKEILTYLNAAKQADPDSKTYEDTATSIASNLFFAVYYSYLMLSPDLSSNGKDLDEYSLDASKKLLSYVKIMEIAFDINPTKIYLEKAINELTNLEKVLWINVDKNGNKTTLDCWRNFSFDAVRTRDRYITKIKKLDSNYQAPEFPKDGGWCFIATAAMGSYDHPQVMELRHFRDEWILEKKWGKSFVKWYYHYGAIAAKSIDKSFVLKKICYLLIVKPLVYLSRIVNSNNNN